ncbi:Trk potassium uptake system protein TrkH [hydrothermal vent metagenome]|uniref:Trk potassium uptake system protein TrkH n=1 Tax=hydrothermal vent metagenome TaxID=652676 RepID=A0A3B0WC19_9ZZZZ
MHFAAIQRIMGLFLMLFSLTLLPPVVIDLLYQEGAARAFFYSYLVLLCIGFLLFIPVRNKTSDLRLRDGFVVVVLFWLVLGVAGAMPFYLYENLDISIADALFESISGLTTTGATVLVGLDNLPHSILFYRQELQWLGGMGIIVLAVAVMPMLGIGGMQLYKAEAPGPVKDSKLTPRIAETAKALWYIYLGLTVACALAYWLAGMSLFDAVGHSFSTVAIGGFSTHDASLGYFDNQAIEIVAIVFMFLGAINFALHFSVVRSKSLMPYLRDSEFKLYASLLIIISSLCIYVLYTQSVYHDFSSAFREALFHTVSIATTSGFVTSDYASWPVFIPVLLLFASFIGGCAGSTGGGIKVIRVLLLIKQGQREIIRLIHPNAQVTVKVGKQPVKNSIIDAVWGFFAAYVALFALMMLILMFNGLDQITAFSAVAATINNLGPGLGEVSANYASLSEFNKLLLCFSMLLGRLEIFTLLVLLTPAFWRK